MSTFLGLVEEIPGISIDRFDEENLNSSAFFLSHCHQDHMNGLNNNFFNNLSKNDKFLYCSHISKSFLVNSFSNLSFDAVSKHIIELPLDEARIIEYVYNHNPMSITITCISSGHCPGSIMFLLNFHEKRVLYTGDFRINIEDFSKLKALHCNNACQSVPLSIDKIYLDTTFLDKKFRIFPSRADSLNILSATVKSWIEKDSRNIVILEISALYGSEFIYIELSKDLKRKIHVKDKVFNIYSKMNILANYVTNNGESTPIHACMSKKDSLKNKIGLKCRTNIGMKNILTIVLSAQKWSEKDTSCIIESDSIRKSTKNICYSTHASYCELEAFIQYFKPVDIFACVCHEERKREIYDLLNKIILTYRAIEISSSIDNIQFSNHKTFFKKNFKSQFFNDDDDNDD